MTSKDVNNLVINKVENREVYNYMVENNLINDDELYLIEHDDSNIINDETKSTDTTYSSSKIEDVIIESINNIDTVTIDDENISTNTVYSSSKVNELVELTNGGTNAIINDIENDSTLTVDLNSLIFDTIYPYKYENLYNLPYEFYRGSAVVYNNEIHLLGGYYGETNHYKFDGSTWTQLDDLPYSFYQGSAVVCNDEIHLLGGSSYSKYHYKFDGTSWTKLEDLPYSFYMGSSLVYDNEIHIMRNYNHYKYNGSTWTQLDNLPYEFYRGSAVIYNNEIHLLGGYYGKTNHYKYDGSTWTQLDDLLYEFYDGKIVVYSNEIHLLGGYDSETNHYKYDGSTWTQLDDLLYSFYQGSAVVCNDEIHLLGGSSYSKSHYLYTRDMSDFSNSKISGFKINNDIEIPMTKFINDETLSIDSAYSSHKTNDLINHNKLKSIIDDINDDLLLVNNINSISLDATDCLYKWKNELNDIPYTYYNGCSVVYDNKLHIMGSSYSSYLDCFAYVDINNIWNYENVELPCEFEQGSVVIYNNEIHLLGGYDSETKHYKFNGSTWIEVSELPYEFHDGSSVVYNNEIHIMGSGVNSSKHYKFDGSKWTKLKDLPYYFYDGSAVVYNNEIHLLGSASFNNYSSPPYSHRKNHYKFDGSTWTKLDDLPYEFHDGCAVVYNNEIHIMSSSYYSYSSSPSNYYKAHYKWNGSTWTQLEDLPYNLYNGSTVVYNNEIHIMGSSSSTYNKAHYKWNGSTWTKLDDLPYEFHDGSSVVYNEKIYILGGDYPSQKYSQKHYVFENSTWIEDIPLPSSITNSFILNDKLYAVCNSYLYEYTGNSWELADENQIYNRTKIFTFKNEIYAVDESGGGDTGVWVNIYKLVNGEWDYCTGINSSGYSNSLYLFILNDKIHFVYGDYYYVISEDTSYESKEPLELPLNTNHLYVINEELHAFCSDLKHYILRNNNWEKVAYSLPYSSTTTSFVLYENKLYMLGGIDKENNNHTMIIDGYTGDLKSIKLENGEIIKLKSNVINDEISSTDTTYSSSKIEEIVNDNKLSAITTDGNKYNINSLIFKNTSYDYTWEEDIELPHLFYGSAIVYNDELHILGGYGSDNTTSHYKWNGSEWIEDIELPDKISSAVVYNDEMYIIISGSKLIYKYIGTSWELVSDNSSFRYDSATLLVSNDELYCIYRSEIGEAVNDFSISKFVNNTWSILDNSIFSSLTYKSFVYNNDIYVVQFAYGNYIGFIKWSDGKWISCEDMINFTPYESLSYISYNNELYAFGNDGSYKYDGIEWIQIDSIPITDIRSVVYNDTIHILGGGNKHYLYQKTPSSNLSTVEILGINIDDDVDVKIELPKIIDDTDSSTTSTYSSSKIEELFSETSGIDDNNASTDSTYSSSKINSLITAVEGKMLTVQSSTTDLTAGSSPLADGVIYFVYE